MTPRDWLDALFAIAPQVLGLAFVVIVLLVAVGFHERSLRKRQIQRAFAGRRQPIQFTRAEQLDLERIYLLRSPESQPPAVRASLESAPVAGRSARSHVQNT